MKQKIIDNFVNKEKYNIFIDEKICPNFDINKNNNNILDEILGKEDTNNLDEGLDEIEDETDEDEDYFYDEINCLGDINNFSKMNFLEILIDTINIASNSYQEILQFLISNKEISKLYSQLKESIKQNQ